ncbi:MAG: type II secretion system protein [Clostridia bacterium]|nr:type II secretion system protein [Clostridia bacterium]
MRKIKKEQGITMMVLVITIVVLIILSAIVIRYSIDGIEYSREKKLLSDLEAVQHAVYEQYEQYKVTGDESFIIGSEASSSDKATLEGNTWKITSPKDNAEKYYKLNQDDLEKIGIENTEDEYIVNYKTGECYNLTQKRTKENHRVLYID